MIKVTRNVFFPSRKKISMVFLPHFLSMLSLQVVSVLKFCPEVPPWLVNAVTVAKTKVNENKDKDFNI